MIPALIFSLCAKVVMASLICKKLTDCNWPTAANRAFGALVKFLTLCIAQGQNKTIDIK
jgi:hypothetical protein